MIVVRLVGGLGNQFFQYAFARKLQTCGKEVVCDLDWFDETELVHGKYQLDRYATVVRACTDEERRRLKKGIRQSFLDYEPGRIHETGTRYYETDNQFYPNLLQCDDAFLQGYFQSEKYFLDIRELLLRELSLKEFGGGQNAEYLGRIRTENSVSVHIRRGDYLNSEDIYGGICTEQYYLSAIRYFKAQVSGAEFFVFSDDIAWCRQLLNGVSHVTFVDVNTNTEGYNDLHLMKSCRHNIIANSSFSWWAAWLNQCENKIVISPDKWIFHRALPDIRCRGWSYMDENGSMV